MKLPFKINAQAIVLIGALAQLVAALAQFIGVLRASP
jgi:hypothetical protein